MGRSLKEALKSICGINRWSYAVFWKIGVQNPSLLIWEDCYYDAMPCSNPPHNSYNGNQEIALEVLERCLVNSNTCGSQREDKVQLIINKMMVANQVHVIGQGLIGRTAFTGNHQWIVSGNYNGNGHPPEVVNEVLVQFSAGMQTLAVIPVIPLGVVQLGSFLPIMENTGFIQSVKDVIIQLDHISGVFLPDNFVTEKSYGHTGLPVNGTKSATGNAFGNMNMIKSSAFSGGLMKSSHGSSFDNRSPESLLVRTGDNLCATANVPKHNGYRSTKSSEIAVLDQYLPLKRQLSNKFASSEVISSGSDVTLDHQSSSDGAGCGLNHGQPAESHYGCDYMENSAKLYASRGGIGRSFMSLRSAVTSHPNRNKLLFPDSPSSWKSVGTDFSNGIFSINKTDNSLSDLVNESTISGTRTSKAYSEELRSKPEYPLVKKEGKDLYDATTVACSLLCNDSFSDLDNTRAASQLTSSLNTIVDDAMIESGGDDLFDILGKEFKNKMLSAYTCNLNDKAGASAINQFKGSCQDATSFQNHNGQSTLECCNLESDNLLEAVVSGIHPGSTQNSDDNTSCKTTLTKASGSCASYCSSKYDHANVSNLKCALSGHSKPPPRPTDAGPTFSMPSSVRNGSKNSSQTSSFYGSPVSSWLEQGLISKCETSITSANSKKAESAGKPNRKRLKPGENPRPKPKDRQLIQDRVKELRELIPNGAKFSIDALLERTIKHMLFLQSVKEHADILKPLADSKVVNKDGELLLKYNFEGGATWAYEVGSKATVCPVVVEDLTPPRRFIVELLCDKNGFFLEIAEMIRGLGLTILNGVMEAQNKRIWARFAVEANKDITRMEIFVSLVHLLEQMSVKSNRQTVEGDMSVHPALTGNMKQQLLITDSQVMC